MEDLKRRFHATAIAALAVVMLLAPAVSSQTERTEDTYRVGVDVTPSNAAVSIQEGTVTATVNVTDETVVAPQQVPGTVAVRRTVDIETRILTPYSEEPTNGWAASVAKRSEQIGPSESHVTTLQVTAQPVATPNFIVVELNVSMTVRDETVYNTASFPVRLDPYRRVSVQIQDAPPRISPNEVTFYNIEVTNIGNYPDTLKLDIVESGKLQIGMTSALALDAKEARSVELSIVAPESFYDYGSTELVTVQASSANNPEASYLASIPVQISGFYLPMWTFPFWVLLVALAAYGGQRTYEKVKRDRRRYGHPAPKYTEEQKEKLEQLKERDKEKYKAVKERLDQQYKEELEAYKERKKKGKARRTGALLAKMEKKRKKKEKLRKSGLKTVKKLKKKGASPEEIYQALEEGEREQLQESLPEILKAPTAAGALVAARDDDEEMSTVDKMRAKKAETERKRLRAEALMLIEHRREEGYDTEQIREELSEPQKLALGDDLEFALEGET